MPAKTEQYIDSCKCARADLARWRDVFVCVDLATSDVPHVFFANDGTRVGSRRAFQDGWDDAPHGGCHPREALAEAARMLRVTGHAVAADDIEARIRVLDETWLPRLDCDFDGDIGREADKRVIAPLLARLTTPVPAASLTAEGPATGPTTAAKPINPTVLKAAKYIRLHPGEKSAVIAEYLDMEPESFRAGIAPELRKMGIWGTRGCKGGYRDTGSSPAGNCNQL